MLFGLWIWDQMGLTNVVTVLTKVLLCNTSFHAVVQLVNEPNRGPNVIGHFQNSDTTGSVMDGFSVKWS